MQKILIKLKNQLKGANLDESAPKESLSDLEFQEIRALMAVLADKDGELTESYLKTEVDYICKNKSGISKELKKGVELLSNKAKELFSKDRFSELTIDQRDRVLSKILRKYPSRFNHSSWRLRSRITSDNIDLLLSSSEGKNFRNFVVRELLLIYYRSRAGWNVVERKEYPSFILSDEESITVEKIEFINGHWMLVLSDTTLEFLNWKNTVISNLIIEKIWIKNNQITADFSREASEKINELSMEKIGDQIDWEGEVSDEEIHSILSRSSTEVAVDISQEFDYVIVGSGPNGAAAAKNLVEKGKSVLVIESGSSHDENNFKTMNHFIRHGEYWNFSPWKYEYNHEDLDLNTWMVRVEGGSSNGWGATTPRFLPSDFELSKKYSVGVDWPISYDDLEPFYCQAESYLGVSGFEDNPWEGQRSQPFPMPGFAMTDSDLMVKAAGEKMGIKFHSVPSARNSGIREGRSACVNYSVCRACPVEAKFCSASVIKRLKNKENFNVIYNAHVRSLDESEGKVTSAIVSFQDKTTKKIKAKNFILASHTIGNTHILLNSKSEKHPNGLGNNSNQLGKYLMDHLKFFLTARVKTKTEAHRMGFETATSLHFHDHPNRGEFAAGRLLVRENAGPSPEEIGFYSGYWGDDLKKEVRDTFGYFITIGGLIEQLPYEFNQVSLSETMKNEFGDPAIKTSWELGRDYEMNSYKQLKMHISKILKTLGGKDINLGMGLAHSGHYSGGHRMGSDSKSSVVDKNLKVHGLGNLFLLGTGNLPTCSTNNPTLTSVALTMRFVDGIN